MPRALVVYESMFGNGHRVAELVAEGLRESGFDVELTRAAYAPASPEVDLLVLGGPTHALGMSRAATRASRPSHVTTAADKARVAAEPDADTVPGVREYLGTLQVLRGQPVGVYDTRSLRSVPAGAARGIARRVTALGAELMTPARGFHVQTVTGPLADGEEQRARAWGAELAGELERRAQERLSDSPGASRT